MADAAGPRRLVLLRHGRTAWNHEARAQGHADVSLDEVGHAQARAVAPYVAALRPTQLWTSDLARARETATHLEAATGLDAVVDARLREYDLGERTGMTMAEYAVEHPDEYAVFRRGRYDIIAGSETTLQVVSRICAALDEVRAALRPGGTAVVVSHGAALKVSVLELLGWPEAHAADLRGMDNCGWTVLDDSGEGGRWRLVAYNRTTDFATHEGVG